MFDGVGKGKGVMLLWCFVGARMLSLGPVESVSKVHWGGSERNMLELLRL